MVPSTRCGIQPVPNRNHSETCTRKLQYINGYHQILCCSHWERKLTWGRPLTPLTMPVASMPLGLVWTRDRLSSPWFEVVTSSYWHCMLIITADVCFPWHPANCSTALKSAVKVKVLRYSVEIYKCTNVPGLIKWHKTQHKSMWVAKIMAYSGTCAHSHWSSWDSPSWGNRAVLHYKD